MSGEWEVKWRKTEPQVDEGSGGLPLPGSPVSGQGMQVLWGWVGGATDLTLPALTQAKLKSFSAKIVQLLKEWTEAFPFDFQDEKAMAELKAITHRVTQCDEVRSLSDPGRVPCLGELSTWSPRQSLSWRGLPGRPICLTPTGAAQLASNTQACPRHPLHMNTLWLEWEWPRPPPPALWVGA